MFSCCRDDITQAGVYFLFCKEADGIRASEGFVVLNGSHIAPEDDETISSGAAMFVIGKSANGLTSLKNAEGITLKDIENDEIKYN